MPHQTARLLIILLTLAQSAGCSDDGPAPSIDAAGMDAGVPDSGSTADTSPGADSVPDAGGPDQHSLPPPTCRWVDAGVGPAGKTKLKVETVASGLEIPWSMAFLSKDDLLVTEMAGHVRLIKAGKLQTKPVLTVKTPTPPKATGQGLHGIVLHPKFSANRYFYIHYTHDTQPEPQNRVARYKLSQDLTSATLDRVILDKIPAGFFHNGGRMRFGADGMLYLSTGDANTPKNGGDLKTLAGKLLRMTDLGKVPADNPWPGSLVALTGIRNSQGFDFLSPKAIYVADHGPSGEHNGTGQDEVTLAQLKDDLGWPDISGCKTAAGKLPPSISWNDAVPPGSIVYYGGDKIPGWKGSVIMASLGQKALVRLQFDPTNPRKVVGQEVYLQGDTTAAYGRLRALELGPDGHLYVTTSNCDDHGTCNPKDKVLRIMAQQ